MRASLGYHIRHHNLNGFTAARLKRMQAIHRKLKRKDEKDEKEEPLGLNQPQDLGGCRAIMNTMEDVKRGEPALKMPTGRLCLR